MKHFTDARSDTIDALRADASLRARINRACLIWDLKGKLRFLYEAKEGEDLEDLKEKASALLKKAAGSFWSAQIWVWSKDSTPAERAVYTAAWEEAKPFDTNIPELRILDRHFSKSVWFKAPLSPPWPLNENTPPILSFFSFKGGVGRTTALVSLAVQLARSGKKVAAMDLDLEAPGLSSILSGADGRSADYGVVDFLLEKGLLESRDMDLADYYYLVDDRAIIGNGPPILVVPAGRLDENYLEKLARLDYDALYQQVDRDTKPVSPFRELLTEIKKQRDIDYLLLDARAGLHDLGGLALSGIAHLDVILGLDSEQSWRGVEVVTRFLGQDRVRQNQKQLSSAIIFALAPEPGEKREEAFQRYLARSYQLFSDHYYDEPEADPDEAMPLPAMDDLTQPHYPMVLGFDPIVQRYQRVADIADRLASGDFQTFAALLLERVGRTIS